MTKFLKAVLFDPKKYTKTMAKNWAMERGLKYSPIKKIKGAWCIIQSPLKAANLKKRDIIQGVRYVVGYAKANKRKTTKRKRNVKANIPKTLMRDLKEEYQDRGLLKWLNYEGYLYGYPLGGAYIDTRQQRYAKKEDREYVKVGKQLAKKYPELVGLYKSPVLFHVLKSEVKRTALYPHPQRNVKIAKYRRREWKLPEDINVTIIQSKYMPYKWDITIKKSGKKVFAEKSVRKREAIESAKRVLYHQFGITEFDFESPSAKHRRNPYSARRNQEEAYDAYTDEYISQEEFDIRADKAFTAPHMGRNKKWLEANDLFYLVEEEKRRKKITAHAEKFIDIFDKLAEPVINKIFRKVKRRVPDAELVEIDRAGVTNVNRSYEGQWEITKHFRIDSVKNDSYSIKELTLSGDLGDLNFGFVVTQTVSSVKGKIASISQIKRLFSKLDEKLIKMMAEKIIDRLKNPTWENRLSESARPNLARPNWKRDKHFYREWRFGKGVSARLTQDTEFPYKWSFVVIERGRRQVGGENLSKRMAITGLKDELYNLHRITWDFYRDKPDAKYNPELMMLKNVSFRKWWEENKDSEWLQDEYEDYLRDFKLTGEYAPLPGERVIDYKEFARKYFMMTGTRPNPELMLINPKTRRPRGGVTRIQSLLFHKDMWTPAKAKKWVKSHGFSAARMAKPTTKKAKYIHFQQFKTDRMDSRIGRFRVVSGFWHGGKYIELPEGVKATVAIEKGAPKVSPNIGGGRMFLDFYIEFSDYETARDASDRLNLTNIEHYLAGHENKIWFADWEHAIAAGVDLEKIGLKGIKVKENPVSRNQGIMCPECLEITPTSKKYEVDEDTWKCHWCGFVWKQRLNPRDIFIDYKKGDKVKLIKDWYTKRMGEEEFEDLPMVTVPKGMKGVVTLKDMHGEFHVLWDNGVETIEMQDTETMYAIRRYGKGKRLNPRSRYGGAMIGRSL